jgi:hypothetical protein
MSKMTIVRTNQGINMQEADVFSNTYVIIQVCAYLGMLGMFIWELIKFQRYFSVLRPSLESLQTNIIPHYGDTLNIKKPTPEVDEERVQLFELFYNNYTHLNGTRTPVVIGFIMLGWSIATQLADYFAGTSYLRVDWSIVMVLVALAATFTAAKVLSSWEGFADKYKREFDSYAAVVYSDPNAR